MSPRRDCAAVLIRLERRSGGIPPLGRLRRRDPHVRRAACLALWLARDSEQFGLPKRPDLFPGNDHLTAKKCGTWLRLPGRHHTRISWSRVWWAPKNKSWLEGEQAVAAILRIEGRDVDVAAIVPEDFGRPQPHVPSATKLRSYDRDEDRELACTRDAHAVLLQ